ncbi:MAG: flavodoxin-dependent (E)-4-hydroxy-3-methylbut-2-enyl-diphosphate synthase [Clostridia bacterium]
MKKSVRVKNLNIGGGAPVSIQTMTNTSTKDIAATLGQVEELFECGADLVRIAVPDLESVTAFGKIVKLAPLPIIADIHFDYKLALKAIDAGAAKIRINPSNIKQKGIKEIALAAKLNNVPIRVGVNRGSVQDKLTPEQLAYLALDAARIFEDEGYDQLVLAVKTSDVADTVKAYRYMHTITDYPLHIGLTESGTVATGTIKSAVAIGALLLDGIGDTIRVSLSGDPKEEVFAAQNILRAAGIDKRYVEVIACPTCARTTLEVSRLAEEIEKRTRSIKKQVKIAVMGCSVNGIGESRDADFGVCGGAERSVIFLHGKPLKTVDNSRILEELTTILESYNG